MLQSELSEACNEYMQEIEAEMRRIMRAADRGAALDIERYAILSQEILLLLILATTAAGLGDTPGGPKVEAHNARQI